MEHEEKPDFEIALDFFKEEVEGVRDYEYYIATSKSAELKSILKQILIEEKKHSTALLSWLNTQSKGILT